MALSSLCHLGIPYDLLKNIQINCGFCDGTFIKIVFLVENQNRTRNNIGFESSNHLIMHTCSSLLKFVFSKHFNRFVYLFVYAVFPQNQLVFYSIIEKSLNNSYSFQTTIAGIELRHFTILPLPSEKM